jgi:hypothetical protein
VRSSLLGGRNVTRGGAGGDIGQNSPASARSPVAHVDGFLIRWIGQRPAHVDTAIGVDGADHIHGIERRTVGAAAIVRRFGKCRRGRGAAVAGVRDDLAGIAGTIWQLKERLGLSGASGQHVYRRAEWTAARRLQLATTLANGERNWRASDGVAAAINHGDDQRLRDESARGTDLSVTADNSERGWVPIIEIVRIQPLLEGLQNGQAIAACGQRVGINGQGVKVISLPPIRDAIAVRVVGGSDGGQIEGKQVLNLTNIGGGEVVGRGRGSPLHVQSAPNFSQILRQHKARLSRYVD